MLHLILLSSALLSFTPCQWGGYLEASRLDRHFHRFSQHSLVGMTILIVSILPLHRRSIPSLPNPYTLLSICATALILFCGRGETWVDLISYSAYFQHQPCLVFLHLRSVETPSMTSGVIALSLVLPLSISRYMGVEQPSRRKEWFSQKKIFSWTAMAGYGLLSASDDQTMVLSKQNDT